MSESQYNIKLLINIGKCFYKKQEYKESYQYFAQAKIFNRKYKDKKLMSMIEKWIDKVRVESLMALILNKSEGKVLANGELGVNIGINTSSNEDLDQVLVNRIRE